MRHDRKVPAEVAEGGHAIQRSPPVLQTFDSRWLIGIAVIVPFALTAGVYWLHQQPTGSHSLSAGPVVEVRLFREPMEQPAPVIMTRPQQEAAASRSEPLIEAVKRPIPEEANMIKAAAPPTSQPEADPDRSTAPAPERRRSTTSGSASAFQRTLMSHIARYLRYPKSASGRQLHGVVHVRFALRRDGTVIEAWVRTSSGHLLLDEAATETIRRAQPLPAIPAELPDALTISLPISFDAP